MWLASLTKGADYYINYNHKHDNARAYHGNATFLYHAHVGLDICVFEVDDKIVAFPHHAIIHRIQNEN